MAGSVRIESQNGGLRYELTGPLDDHAYRVIIEGDVEVERVGGDA